MPNLELTRQKKALLIRKELKKDHNRGNTEIARACGLSSTEEWRVRRERDEMKLPRLKGEQECKWPACIPKPEDLKEAFLTKDQNRVFKSIQTHFKDKRSRRLLIMGLDWWAYNADDVRTMIQRVSPTRIASAINHHWSSDEITTLVKHLKGRVGHADD